MEDAHHNLELVECPVASITTSHPSVDDQDARTVELSRRLPWKRALLALLICTAIIGWFAPAIVGRTALRHQFIGLLFPAYTGEGHIGAVDLGWNAPVLLRDVKLTDGEGQQWLHVPEAHSSEPLYKLIWGESPDLGTFTLIRPELTVHLREGGSDFEDYLIEALTSDPNSAPSALTVEIQNGTASWIDPLGHPVPGGIASLDAVIHQPADLPLPSPVSATGQMTDGENAGSFQIQIDQPENQASEGRLKSDLSLKRIPLATVAPWLARLGYPVTATGLISSDLEISASSSEVVPLQVEGHVTAEKLRIPLPASITPDPILAEKVELRTLANYDGENIAFERTTFSSDALQLELTGSLAPQEIAANSDWRGQLRALLHTSLDLKGTLDLSRIPRVVTIPSATARTVDSGQVHFSWTTENSSGVRRGIADIATRDLVASATDQQAIKANPFQLNVVLKDDAQGLAAEELTVNSDFVKLNGSIATTGGEIDFDLDLDKLRAQLAQFLPMADNAFAGRATGSLTLTPSEKVKTAIDATGNAHLTNFMVNWAGYKWSEKDFQAEGSATLAFADQSVKSIHAAELKINSVEGDHLSLETADTFTPDNANLGPFQFSVSGELARWQNRLQSWAVLPTDFGWQLGGGFVANGILLSEASQLSLSKIDATATQFKARGGAWDLQEPEVKITGDALYRAQNEILSSNNLRLECNTVGLQTKLLHWPLAGTEPARFEGTVRGSASEFCRHLLSQDSSLVLSGVMEGGVAVTHEPETSSFQTLLRIEKPALIQRESASSAGATFWSDESATLQLDASYAATPDQLNVKTAAWKSQGIGLSLAGQIQELSTRSVAALQGQFDYDWEQVRSRVPLMQHPDVQAVGKGTKAITVKGPLLTESAWIDPALFAEMGLAWESLNLWGVPVGPGEARTRVKQSRFSIGTTRVPLAGGSAQFGGAIPLTPPVTFAMSRGRYVHLAQLTPELCRSWITYAAPLLADVTEVSGVASLDINNGAIPLMNPQAAQINAVLSLENIVAQPGPVARSLLQTVRQIQTIAGRDPTRGTDLRLSAPSQQVQMQIANGRVHHDQFQIRLGDTDGITIQTSGSVGFDNSIQLIAEIPLDRSWFRDERIATALGGQTLRIPIGGTLSQPVPDPRALQDFSSRAASGAVRNLLESQIEKQLEKQLGEPLGEPGENPLMDLLRRQK